ncbi:hypothetical protein PF010_g31497, partial [Phytophthora fragariae]
MTTLLVFVILSWGDPDPCMTIAYGETAIQAKSNKLFCFLRNEYILGDSAFQASPVMIPGFKKPAGGIMGPTHAYFNTKLAKARIKLKHCIGLIKTRFQWLKDIRLMLNKRRHLRKIIRYVTCACILHNLLIAEPVPKQCDDEIRANGSSY